MLQLPPAADVTINWPGLVPEAIVNDPGVMLPALNGNVTATVSGVAVAELLHPIAVTPTNAFPENNGFQLTVAVPPAPLIVPASPGVRLQV